MVWYIQAYWSLKQIPGWSIIKLSDPTYHCLVTTIHLGDCLKLLIQDVVRGDWWRNSRSLVAHQFCRIYHKHLYPFCLSAFNSFEMLENKRFLFHLKDTYFIFQTYPTYLSSQFVVNPLGTIIIITTKQWNTKLCCIWKCFSRILYMLQLYKPW